MDKMDRDIIENLSGSARKRFDMLDRNSQKKLLLQAKEMALVEEKQRGRKNYRQKKDAVKAIMDKHKEDKLGNQLSPADASVDTDMKSSVSRGSPSSTQVLSSVDGAINSYKNYATAVLAIMLIGQREYEKEVSRDETPINIPKNMMSHRTIRSANNKVKNGIQTALRKQRMKKQARNAVSGSARTAKGGVKAAKESAKAVSSATKSIVSALMNNPVVWIGLLILIVLAIVIGVVASVVSVGGAANSSTSSSYEAKVSAKTEGYRELVTTYCEKYEIDDYVDLCLAMIEQESGGNPPDVMQTEQSYYNKKPPIDSAEESIDCGTHELSDCLKKAKCKDATDISAIKLAIQGYNFGNGYIDWAVKNYGGYSRDNAVIFSNKMKAQLHVSGYGDVDYVPHVLRYYIPTADATVSNESAEKLLKELKENNEASEQVWKMIERGATLIGKVKYSMDNRQGDGRDNPEYLDCSSFTAWAFHKSGITSIPYGSTTATFIGSSKFEDISGSELKPGDIGLKSKTGETGGANHVGIYCGKLKNGTKVWIHCTSSSSTSLTGNTSGPMFGAYTNFTYFRRLKKWK